MKYTVIEAFVDLQDNNHLYRVGDEFPHPGKDVSFARIDELASAKNLLGKPLISANEEAVKAEPKKEAKAEAKPEVKADELTPEEIDQMPYFSLKAEAKKRGIDAEGKKAQVLREEIKASL